MELHGSELALMAAMLVAVVAGAWFVSQRSVRKAIARFQSEWERQLSALDDAIQALEARLAEMRAAREGAGGAAEPTGYGEDETRLAEEEQEAVGPEVKAAIAAAAVAMLGKNARVRSAALAHETVSPWSQQGRVIVQTSHNLRPSRWNSAEASRGKEA